MQRAILSAGRAAPFAVAGAGGAHHHLQQPQTSAAPHSSLLATEERDDDFVHIFEGPIQHQEVATALADLSAIGGGTVVARTPRPYAQPLIEELESDASSTGSAANHLMASVDTLSPAFAAYTAEELGPEGASAMDLLVATVTTVLQDERVVTAITATLHADPAFEALMQRVQPRGLADRTHPLLLAHELADAEAEVGATGNPVLDLIEGISRGLSVAAVQVGEVIVRLGGFLRGAFAALIEPPGGASLDGGPRAERNNLQRKIVQVAAAAAVLILTRRFALAARMAF